MLKRFLPSALVLLGLASFALAACGGGGGGGGSAVVPPQPSPSPSAGTARIQHVIILIQENRSVDDLFNGFPGADTVLSGKTSTGATVALQPVGLEAPLDLDHSHISRDSHGNIIPGGFVTEYNGGAMNGFDQERLLPQGGYTPPPDVAYAYVPQSETKPLFALAEQFAFADHMFQTNQGPSFPAHQYLISGTSIPATGSALLAAENVTFPPGFRSPFEGCDSPAGSTVYLVDQNGDESSSQFPCFDHPALTDLLDAKGVSWRYYTPFPYWLWSGPEAIHHIRYGPDWANVSVPEINFFTDVAAGRLPAVSWLIPSGGNSDHPGSDSTAGPSWVADVANTIGTSKYWNNTVIFVTWDDWGGWYDHVAPQIYDSYELGFRVPLMVISPYAKAGYVSHKQHEFGSILKFTEEQFGLGSLGYTDARADDLSDCFNFSQSPLPYHTVSAPYSHAQLMRRWKPTPPDND